MDDILFLNWETALDVVAIFLCVLIIAFLIRNRIISRRRFTAAQKRSGGSSFHSQLNTLFMAQKSEKALDAVSVKLDEERRRLQEWVAENSRDGEMTIKSDLDGRDKENTLFKSVSPASVSHSNIRPTDPYADIPALHASGMQLLDISSKIGRPVAEIELYLKVYSKRLPKQDFFIDGNDSRNTDERQLFPYR